MKKCLSLLLILLLTLTAVPVLAEETVWDFNPDQFRLTGYEGPGGDVVIPAEIDGAPVRFVDYHVFNSRSDITSVTFPDSVQLIDGNVCCWVSSLTSLTLPESLQIIGDGCFQNLEALNALTVPASVLYIGSGAFSDAYSLQTVTFEGLCPIMTGDAFDSLPESAVVYVPDDQTDAYAAAFADLGLTVNLQASGREAVVVELPEKPEDFSFDPFTGTVIDYHGAGD